MINPLVSDLSQYTDTQLEDRIRDLQRKYFISHNPDVQFQIANLLDVYKDELRTRQAIAAQRQKDENGDNGLDNLINVS